MNTEPNGSSIDGDARWKAVIVRTGGSRWALRASDVVEIMRPLPVRTVASTFPAMIGLVVVRGAPIPLVDAAMLLSGTAEARPTRLVTVRCGARCVALLVASVEGVRTVEAAAMNDTASLATAAGAGTIAQLGVLDRDFLGVISMAKLLPDPAA